MDKRGRGPLRTVDMRSGRGHRIIGILSDRSVHPRVRGAQGGQTAVAVLEFRSIPACVGLRGK